MIVPSNSGGCAKAPVYQAKNETDVVLLTETPQVISLYTGEELDVEHVPNGLIRTLHFTFDCRGKATSCFDNDLIVKTELHEILRLGKSTTFINMEYEAILDTVNGELDEDINDL